MKRLFKSLEIRRKALKRAAWLRPTLFVVDFVLLGAGFFINPTVGFVLGLILILLNEWLTPVVVQKIFFKELSSRISLNGVVNPKVIPGHASNKTKAKEIRNKHNNVQ